MNDKETSDSSKVTTDPVFSAKLFTQRRTAKKLIEESRTDTDFLLFLSASVFITTLGLLMDNPIVIVGAMLVAPILFPILALGLGVVTSSGDAIKRAGRILGKTLMIGVGVSFVTAFLINASSFTEQLKLLTDPDLFLFFFISFAAGIIASFSWVKEDTALSLPGVAITVSLVPPLAAIGVSLALLSKALLVGSVLLFLINLLGVVLASTVVFSLFGFSNIRAYQDKKIHEEEEAREAAKLEKEKEAEPDPEDNPQPDA